MLKLKNTHEQKHTDGGQRRIEKISEMGYTTWSRQYPIAPRMRTWLRYAETITGLGGIPADFDYQFRLNSLFDPNFTGTGHQPRGFDQISALYNRYRVYRCNYKVMFTQENSGIINNIATVYCSNSTNASATFIDAAEQPVSSSRPFSVYQQATIVGGVDLAKLNGKTWEAYASDDTTQAIVSASPAEVLQLHCTAQNTIGSSITCSISVIMDFDCEFSDINQLASS